MASSAKPSWVSHPPRVGNIVTCKYPGDPKGELRPVLVLQKREGDKGGFAVRVAYGTKNLNKEKRAHIDLIIEDQHLVDACGLAVPTRFDLENIAVLPWEPPDCGCWSGYNSPVIGELPTDQQIECAYKLAAIQNKSSGAS